MSELSAAKLKAKEARESFEHRDLRRTVEIMLAAIGVQRDIRAQLLSHGLSGVQDRHYDRHQYQDENRTALEVCNAVHWSQADLRRKAGLPERKPGHFWPGKVKNCYGAHTAPRVFVCDNPPEEIPQ